MADPLSIAAGIIAVAGAANAVAKGAIAFYRISRRAGSIAEEAEFFASHVSTFGSIIQSVHNTLRDHYSRCSDSPMLHKLDRLKVLDGLIHQVKWVMRRLKHLRPRIRAHESGLGWIARLQWVWQKGEREVMCTWVERLKAGFLIILLGIIYETLQQRASAQAPSSVEYYRLRKEMKNHRRLIATNREAIKILKYRLDKYERTTWRHDEGLDDGYNHTEEKLLDLETQPTKDRTSAYELHPSNRYGSMSADDMQEPMSQWDSMSIETDRSAAQQHMGRDTPEPGLQSTSIIPTPQTTRDDGDYLSVQPSDNSIFCDPEQNLEAIVGYVNNIRTSAMLNRGFSENVISFSHAQTLGVVVKEWEEDLPPKEINFGGNHREPVRGTAKFEWEQSPSSHLRPLKVTCNVCDHTPSDLIFGQQFLRRREHYWGTRRSTT